MRVVVMDGHPAMRSGLAVLLVGSGTRVVGEAGTGEEVVGIVREERPDVVLMGLNPAGEVEGMEALRRIKTLPDAPRVLVHTAYNFSDDVSSCFLAGADSYLHKSTGREELLEVLERTAEGESVWRPGERIGEVRGRTAQALATGERLTKREKEILALLLRRYTNSEICRSLHISSQTAKNHVSNVLRKLGARNRGQLLAGAA